MTGGSRRKQIQAYRLYCYTGYVAEVYDGDTVTLSPVDLGMWTNLTKVKARLYGINTPEMRGTERAAGTIIRDVLRDVILDQWVLIVTHLDRAADPSRGKYGRLLAEILAPVTPDGPVVNINEWLTEEHGVKVEGYGRTVAFTDPAVLVHED
jgi:micrococcal nuclease